MRAKKLAVCSVLATAMVLGSVAPASAQLNPLLDLLLNPEEQPPPPDPGAPPPEDPGAPAPPPAPGAPPRDQQNAAARPPSRGATFPLRLPSIARSPAKNTDTLIANLQPVVSQGVPLEDAMLQVAAPYPIAGPSNFSHDWGFPRWTPVPHLHEGTDLFADFGTPIVTSEGGRVIKKGTAGAGGISAWIVGDSGNAYYYAHMQSWARGLEVGQRVEMGQVIGFVGDTGNAVGGAPHLHFEIHPGSPRSPGGPGSPARDPKPFLDDALRRAEQQAEAFASGGGDLSGTPGRPRVAEQATRYPILVPKTELDELIVEAEMQGPEDLMWFSMLEPSLGVMGLAKHTAADTGLPANDLSEEELADAERLDEVREAVAARAESVEQFVESPLGEAKEAEPLIR